MNKMKNKNNESEPIEQKKIPMNDYKNYINSKKYQGLISNFSKIGFFITLAVSILIYKNLFENRLLEKDKELENIKEQLNFVTKEKSKLQSTFLTQNATIQDQILLLQNKYNKYKDDIALSKNVNKELKNQLKLYQSELKTQKEEFQFKSDNFEKQIKDFENIINKYVNELKKQSTITQKENTHETKETKEYYDKKINKLNEHINDLYQKCNRLEENISMEQKYKFDNNDNIIDNDNNKYDLEFIDNNKECFTNVINSLTVMNENLSNSYLKNCFKNGLNYDICINGSYCNPKSILSSVNVSKSPIEGFNEKLFSYLLNKDGFNKAFARITNRRKNVAIFNFFYGRNYGAVLTAYAIQTILLKLEYNPYLIKVTDVKKPSTNPFFIFEKDNLFTTKNIIKQNDLKLLNMYFDNFVVGSDQIWRYKYIKKYYKTYFFSFVEEHKKKIACAVSFGQKDWEGNETVTEEIKDYTKRFNAISVREKSGVDICNNTFGVNAKAIFDPVFYLMKNDWKKLLDKSTLNLKSSCLVYVLDKSKKIAEQVDSIIEKENLTKFWIKNGVTNVYDFVKSINTSQKVITNSFHGLCFSIIFHKDFICLVNKNRGEDRFVSLLSDLGLMDRLFYDLSEVDWKKLPPIDYQKVEKIIEQKRIEGINYLLSNLEEKVDLENNNDTYKKQIKNFEITKDKYVKELNEKETKINTLQNRIEAYEKDLKNAQAELLNVKKNNKKDSVKKLTYSEKEYSYDRNFFMKNNMNSKETFNKLGYSLVFHTHSLEKGLSHFELRPFGKKKVKKIINILKAELKYDNHERHFYFINGINTLREYKKTYEENYWTDQPEYLEVSDFLKYYDNIEEQKTGAYILTKEELEKDYSIDYKKFMKSRHSTRNYKHTQLKLEDIKEAVEIAKFSPSACNRQFIKLHYYPTGQMKQNVLDYSVGKGGLYLEGVNTFIVTFDVNALNGVGERNQGYFNAGLFSANLVNAFHSLGIGTCFIQFNNPSKEEEKLKELNEIPPNERIAVILYAGYYDDKTIFNVSPRRDFEDYFVEHK